MILINRFVCFLFVASLSIRLANAQVEPSGREISQFSDVQHAVSFSDRQEELSPKRILGIVPNYRTSEIVKDYSPITAKQKFALAGEDSFDRGTFILGAFFGGQAQLTKSTSSWRGGSGFARYYSASYADFAVGNYMTEAVFPTIFHQDPRYFRSGSGSGWSRLGSAVKQIFWTRADSGGMQFNFSEVVGASTGVAISNAYYPDNRNATDAVTKLGIQIGVDMVGNILKEFSPEISRIFSRHHRP